MFVSKSKSAGRIKGGARARALGAVGITVLAVTAGCAASTEDASSPESLGAETDALGISAGGLGTIGALASMTVDAPFVVTGLAHKCVDFGGAAYQAPGSPVMLYGCNGSIAQQVRVVEINDGTHDVWMAAGGRFCFGVRGGVVATGRPLELQTCNNASPAQRFALDGDTIYMGHQASGRVTRDLVIAVDHGRGANRTALVVGLPTFPSPQPDGQDDIGRRLDDAEDFRFTAAGSAQFPTRGFTRVSTVAELDRALSAATWGSVIEVAPGANIVINDTNERPLNAGVTLRGNRIGMEIGPQINRNDRREGVFVRVLGNDARMTGLRFRGPNTSKDDDLPLVTGVLADQSFRVTIDHNDMSAWTNAAVSAAGPFDDQPACIVGVLEPARNIRVVRNFIHDNSREGFAYGVVSGDGANPYVDGNDFARNRHAVAADANGRTNYTAAYNLITEANDYCWVSWPACWKEQDLDVHGSDPSSHHQGGTAGNLFFMMNNTFLDSGKNIDVRGVPCNMVTIKGNVFASDDQGEAIKSVTYDAWRLSLSNNTYGASQSVSVTGDFDGDGVQDDFLATGAAWYYRPGHTSEWRFLNRANDRVPTLSFGDFDGDGRTDVRAVSTSDGVTETSWGGSSPWDRPLKVVGVPIDIGVAREL